MEQIKTWINHGHNMAIATFLFTLVSISIYGTYLSCDYKIKKYRGIKYRGIKFNTKTISYIAIMIAVSVAVTVVISMTVPITAFPPIRVAFEGVMVKITGLMFGPVVGVIVALITETLTLAFIPSYIHVAYLLIILSFGIWSGFIHFFMKFKGKKRFITLIISNLFILGFTAAIAGVTWNENIDPPFGISFLAGKNVTTYLFIIIMMFLILCSWIIVFLSYVWKKQSRLDVIIPIFLMCTITETLSTVLIGGWGDAAFLGMTQTTGGYISMMMVNLIQSPFRVLFNVLIITTVYVVLKPLIRVNILD